MLLCMGMGILAIGHDLHCLIVGHEEHMVDHEILTPDFVNLSELQATAGVHPASKLRSTQKATTGERNWEYDSMISSFITNLSSFASVSRQIPPRAPRSIQNKSKKT